MRTLCWYVAMALVTNVSEYFKWVGIPSLMDTADEGMKGALCVLIGIPTIIAFYWSLVLCIRADIAQIKSF